MNIQISRGELLSALQSVIGVVERRQSLPILGNFLLTAKDDVLTVAGTDLELQVTRSITVQNLKPGRVTAPARKLHDIVRGLPEGASVGLEVADNRLIVRSGRSRYMLATLPAEEFPLFSAVSAGSELTLPSRDLKSLFGKTHFAMAQQDVRYYLNGMLLETRGKRIRTVATDGHRLALSEFMLEMPRTDDAQVILPRKTVLEIQRLLDNDDTSIRLVFSDNQIQIELPEVQIASKLIDGKFPDYERVIPDDSDKVIIGNRGKIRAALARAAILSNEKFRGVRLILDGEKTLKIQTQNPDLEEAEEEVEIQYSGGPLEIGFNVGYLMDALDAIEGDDFVFNLRSPDASGLIQDAQNGSARFVVMPMRL